MQNCRKKNKRGSKTKGEFKIKEIENVNEQFQKNRLFMGSNYYKIFTIIDYPLKIQMGWLAKILNNIGIIASIHIEPVDNSLLLQAVNSRVRQARGLAKSVRDEVEKQRKEREVEEAKNMITEIDQNNETIWQFSKTIRYGPRFHHRTGLRNSR